MQLDLPRIGSSELVTMLKKDTEYYIDLCKEEGNAPQRNLVQQHIEMLISEIKTRDGYKNIDWDLIPCEA